MDKLKNWIGIISVAVLGAKAGAQTATFTEGLQVKIQNDGAPSVIGNDLSGYFINGGGTLAGDSAHAYDFIQFDKVSDSDPAGGATCFNTAAGKM